jgi:hypothetical protein
MVSLDDNRVRELYESSDENPQSFVLPNTMTRLDTQRNLIGQRLHINDDQTLLAVNTDDDEDTIEFYEVENNRNCLIQIAALGGVPIASDCEISHETLEFQGHIHSIYDFKNVEMTGFFNVMNYLQNEPNGNIMMIVRGGRHDSPSRCCEGTGYGVRIYWSENGNNKGKIEVVKAPFHPYYVPKNPVIVSESIIPSFFQRWFGVKFAVTNIIENNENKVLIKVFLCPNDTEADSNWIPISETRDYVGCNWTNTHIQCNGRTNDIPIFWGGYYATYRWTNANTVYFKWLSVREINPIY